MLTALVRSATRIHRDVSRSTGPGSTTQCSRGIPLLREDLGAAAGGRCPQSIAAITLGCVRRARESRQCHAEEAYPDDRDSR